MTFDQFVVFEDTEQIKLKNDQKAKLVEDGCHDKIRYHWLTQEIRKRSLEARQLYFENRPQAMEYDNPDDSYESSANLQRPVLAEAVDSVHAQLHQSIYPSDESFFKAIPKNQIAKENKNIYEAHAQNRLEKLKFMIKTTKDEINAMLDGQSAVACPFVRKTKKKAVYKPKLQLFGISLGLKKTYVDEVEVEGTDYVPLMFQDWWVDPTVDDLDDTAFIWRRWVSPEELRSVKAFQNTEDVQPYKIEWDLDESDKQLNYNYMGIQYTSTLLDDCDYEQQMACDSILLYEKWGDFWIDDKFYENHVLVWSNDHNFHYFGPSEYDHGKKPFVVGPFIPIPGTLMGKSLAQDIIPLCHALNTLLNMSIDILNAEADPSYTAIATDDVLFESVAEGKIPVGNGKYIWVKNHDSLRPISKDLSGLKIIFDLMENLKAEIRESTGGVPYTTGALSPEADAKTATETNVLASGTSTRIQARIQNYETFKLAPYMEMTFENDRQFTSEAIFVPDFDEPLMPDDLKQMEMDMKITGSKSIMNKQQEINNLNNLAFSIIPQFIQAGIGTLKKEVAEFDGIGIAKQILRRQNINPEDYIKTVVTPEGEASNITNPAGVNNAMNKQGGINGLPALPGAQPGPENPGLAAA